MADLSQLKSGIKSQIQIRILMPVRMSMNLLSLKHFCEGFSHKNAGFCIR